MVDSLPCHHRHLHHQWRVIVATIVATVQSIASVPHQVFRHKINPTRGIWMARMDETLSTLVPTTNAIAETVAAAEADHQGIMDGIDEALEMITIGITLGADGTIGAGREATAGIVVEADVDDVIVLEIALGTDLAVGQGVDQDRTVTRGIDLPHDQGTRDVIAREIDPVIGLRHEIDLGIDLIDPASVVAGKATIMVEALRPNAAEAQAQLTLAKIARATRPMAQLQRTTTAKMVKCPTGVRKKILEGGAVGAEAVEETEREEKRVVMPAVEAALLALPTTRGSKVYGTSRLWSKLVRVNAI
mmetsp:Transcript_4365/g.10251  ORF Transcript_4365/g.10251 Transcript_4365/m.10251 type:complete len:303 (+) Transcript_4365:3398-4306(+)